MSMSHQYGSYVIVDVLLKKEPMQIFLHDDDYFVTVPLLIFIKPTDQTVGFWTRTNGKYDHEGVERRHIELSQGSMKIEIAIFNGQFRIIFDDVHFKFYDQRLSMEDVKKITVSSQDGELNSIEFGQYRTEEEPVASHSGNEVETKENGHQQNVDWT